MHLIIQYLPKQHTIILKENMIDINDNDFINNFDAKKAVVGVIGYGYVGQAVEHFFKKSCNVLVYDKAKTELSNMDDIICNAQIMFIAVPTPMRKDGSCYTGIIESVLNNISNTANKLNRDINSFIVVIKSTVYPGFIESMKEKYSGMRITFSPEFLTEKNSIHDFENTNRIIIGGDDNDVIVVSKYFESVISDKIKNNEVLLIQCSPTVAEMVKLYTNGILATKVTFSNEVYLMCNKLGISYNEVRILSVLDPRIGSSHTTVPGHDGKIGFSGSCFPKDINNLSHTAKRLGTEEKLFSAVIERNNELRSEKDWEQLEGRAVINEHD